MGIVIATFVSVMAVTARAPVKGASWSGLRRTKGRLFDAASAAARGADQPRS